MNWSTIISRIMRSINGIHLISCDVSLPLNLFQILLRVVTGLAFAAAELQT